MSGDARGRRAETPTAIPAKGWKDIALRVKDEITTDHVGLIAAGVAFYALLALFPAVTALLAISGLLIEPSDLVGQLERLAAIMPREAAEIILGQAQEVAGSREGGLGLAAVFGILLALYSASKGMGSLMEGLNVAYDEEEKRGFFWLKAVTLMLTVGLILGVIVALVVVMGIPAVMAVVNLGAVTEWLAIGLGWLVMIALMIFGLALIYGVGPSRDRAEWRWLTPGALVATGLWVVASIGFAFYAANFGSYNESFGSLGGVIVLLTWLWLSAYIVLAGAELNAEMEAQTRHDTTVGPDAPMGERGAQKADHLGETKA
ncbi:YihY/virulence factor BrkB family protein [Roseobacter sp. HKCCA0434]|uniref:YihY/virulence factor BrkB family protein n=1 Tax=Roseobacter sp. HKCCA0434 TaxID=3079297 RepID=UPI002905E194|nr:YihY/virulence factor BrkB family protein [Roseobacter sp. HKCCA0434]